jgi:hypothetical protein
MGHPVPMVISPPLQGQDPRSLFDQLDVNHDGKISREEFMRVAPSALQQPPSQHMVEPIAVTPQRPLPYVAPPAAGQAVAYPSQLQGLPSQQAVQPSSASMHPGQALAPGTGRPSLTMPVPTSMPGPGTFVAGRPSYSPPILMGHAHPSLVPAPAPGSVGAVPIMPHTYGAPLVQQQHPQMMQSQPGRFVLQQNHSYVPPTASAMQVVAPRVQSYVPPQGVRSYVPPGVATPGASCSAVPAAAVALNAAAAGHAVGMMPRILQPGMMPGVLHPGMMQLHAPGMTPGVPHGMTPGVPGMPPINFFGHPGAAACGGSPQFMAMPSEGARQSTASY